ncbi:MAG: division/cell wall cluster transcriptional repressor MraZ [Acidimicrobiales bacterium]
MKHFAGEFRPAVDPAGRVVLPALFRDRLAGEIMVTYHPDGCLALYTEDVYTAQGKVMEEMARGGAVHRAVARQYFNKSHPVTLDRQGRLQLPVALKAKAGIADKVVVSGNGSWVEIWNPERYAVNEELAEAADM